MLSICVCIPFTPLWVERGACTSDSVLDRGYVLPSLGFVHGRRRRIYALHVLWYECVYALRRLRIRLTGVPWVHMGAADVHL